MGLSPHASMEFWLPSLTTVRIPEGVDGKRVARRLLVEHGIEIAGGLGDLAGVVWRIGCMGHSARPANVMVLLAALGGVVAAEGGTVDQPAGLATAAERLTPD